VEYKKPDIGLIQLTTLLLPDDPSLGQEVALALSQPDVYVRTFRRRFGDLSDCEVSEIDWYEPETFWGMAWDAVIWGLEERGHLVFFDWKEANEAIVQGVAHILNNKTGHSGDWDWIATTWDDSWDNAQPMMAFLRAMGDYTMNSHQLILTSLSRGSDDYPMTFVSPEAFVTCQRMAYQQTGFHLVTGWYGTATKRAFLDMLPREQHLHFIKYELLGSAKAAKAFTDALVRMDLEDKMSSQGLGPNKRVAYLLEETEHIFDVVKNVLPD